MPGNGIAIAQCDRNPAGDLRDAMRPVEACHHAAIVDPARALLRPSPRRGACSGAHGGSALRCLGFTVWRWAKDRRLPAQMKRGGVTAWNVGDLCRSKTAAV